MNPTNLCNQHVGSTAHLGYGRAGAACRVDGGKQGELRREASDLAQGRQRSSICRPRGDHSEEDQGKGQNMKVSCREARKLREQSG